MDATLPGQLAELRRNNENFNAQLSSIVLIEEPNHHGLLPFFSICKNLAHRYGSS